jgi:hypothetical protein
MMEISQIGGNPKMRLSQTTEGKLYPYYLILTMVFSKPGYLEFIIIKS